MPERALTDEVKAVATEMGADLVGIAPVERFAEAPLPASPLGHLPGARSVIVAAIHHPDACVELSGDPTVHDMGAYGPIQGDMNMKLGSIAFAIGRLLERRGHPTMPIVPTNVWRYREWPGVPTPFTADLSQRHAGVAAGLGQIGWNGLFLSPEYGPRQRLVSIITQADLVASPMYDGPNLCDDCYLCVDKCPTRSISRERTVTVRIGGREFTYGYLDKWRCSWSEHWGIDAYLPLPDVVEEHAIVEALAKHGQRGGAMGACLRFCMPPHLRRADPDYSPAYRRERRAERGVADRRSRETERDYGTRPSRPD
jgi:ferredoxin